MLAVAAPGQLAVHQAGGAVVDLEDAEEEVAAPEAQHVVVFRDLGLRRDHDGPLVRPVPKVWRSG